MTGVDSGASLLKPLYWSKVGPQRTATEPAIDPAIESVIEDCDRECDRECV